MTGETELRHYAMQLRVSGDEKKPVLEGHAAVFDQLSEDLGGFREKIAPGAFADTIRRDDIRALWNHDDGLVLGRVKAGTLELKEDAHGLAFSNRPPDTAWFRDRMVSLRRGDVTGVSFGFVTETDEWNDVDGGRVRTLKKVRLFEVSPGVAFPAYPQTDVALASMRRWFGSVGGLRRDAVALDLRSRKLRLRELELGRGARLRGEADLDLRRRQLRLVGLSL